MAEELVLDVLLVIGLAGYVAYGVRNGLSRSLFTIAGIIGGVVAAFFLAPLVAGLLSEPLLRLIVTVALAVGLVAAGQAIGATIGRAIRRGIALGPLSGIDRVVGGIVTGVVAALVASMVAFSVSQLGVPVLSRAIAGSNVLRIIAAVTPDPVEAFLAQVRGAVVDRGIPLVGTALGTRSPIPPVIDTGSTELNVAAQSVVRITGNAYSCGQSQAGSGFVVSDDRVVTNAHVVAGVSEPVVETSGGQALPGSVVYFDPVVDLAIIAVPGLDPVPLPRTDTLATTQTAAFQGFPYGGPFSSGAAQVLSIEVAPVADIYDSVRTPREVYTLAADVRAGNSGGPLLDLTGRVAGIIFARSADTANLGYAMTMTELGPVVDRSAALDSPVSSGECIRN